MNKRERLALIKDFVSRYEIDTQEAIVEHLKAAGVVATQATVSRDIKEIGIIKVPHGTTYIYGFANQAGGLRKKSDKLVKLVTVLNDMISVEAVPGSTAFLKKQLRQQFTEELFSVVADDDTLLLVIKNPINIPRMMETIRMW